LGSPEASALVLSQKTVLPGKESGRVRRVEG
jgi:hypothetical protein